MFLYGVGATMNATGALMATASWSAAVAAGDARFVADLAAKIRWDSRTAVDPDAPADVMARREQIASGTWDALCWVLDVTDLCPSSGQARPVRSRRVVEVEAGLAEELRQVCSAGGATSSAGAPAALYLGGVADALDFVLGRRRRFWWAPLPEVLRGGRDEFGRSPA